jgi:3-oxoacyl-[acyl-carrier protein] reductase
MADQSIPQRVAIVTGAGRGLGRAMALGLARAGARVLVTAAREMAEVEATAALGEGRILPLVADVTLEEDARRVVAEALGRFGRLDILVNNAGRGMKYVSDTFMTEPTRFWEVPAAVWRLVMDTNVNGPFHMARAATPHMLAGGWGRIVNISMNKATMRRLGFSPYGPSKAALESETAIWAEDLRGTGVTVNALLPGGATLSGMIPDTFPEASRAALLRPEIMVPPLLWLASPEADGITGLRFDAHVWREEEPLARAEPACWG